VKSAAGDTAKPQIQAFQDSLDQLGNALSNASASSVIGIANAAKNAVQSGQDLLTALNNLKCS
jgi:hypothetical protein